MEFCEKPKVEQHASIVEALANLINWKIDREPRGGKDEL